STVALCLSPRCQSYRLDSQFQILCCHAFIRAPLSGLKLAETASLPAIVLYGWVSRRDLLQRSWLHAAWLCTLRLAARICSMHLQLSWLPPVIRSFHLHNRAPHLRHVL